MDRLCEYLSMQVLQDTLSEVREMVAHKPKDVGNVVMLKTKISRFLDKSKGIFEAINPAGVQEGKELARDIASVVKCGDEWNEWELEKSTILIARALREAELRGIKAGLEAGAKVAERDAINFGRLGISGNKETDEMKRTQKYQMCSHTADSLIDVRNEIRALNPETILEGK